MCLQSTSNMAEQLSGYLTRNKCVKLKQQVSLRSFIGNHHCCFSPGPELKRGFSFFLLLPLPANMAGCRPGCSSSDVGVTTEWDCFCALPGCASTTLISSIYRTHCIQSTYLLRTSARQNHSLLIAVESEIERTAECGGGEG